MKIIQYIILEYSGDQLVALYEVIFMFHVLKECLKCMLNCLQFST